MTTALNLLVPSNPEARAVGESKALLLGLDGANWSLFWPWLAKGKMPTLAKLLKISAHGTLESTLPPMSAPAWASFATGKNPGKHGVFDFITPLQSLSATKTLSRSDIDGETFYEAIERAGHSCIIINLPYSWPPRIDGPVIPDFTAEGNNLIPKTLIDSVRELSEYRVVPDTSLLVDGKLDAYLGDIRKLERTRFNCAKKLFRMEWDLFFVMFSGTDWVQHWRFDGLVSGTAADQSPEVKFLADLDDYISWFHDNLPGDAVMLIMSDHGFQHRTEMFHVNEWLRQEGYLSVKRGHPRQVNSHQLARATKESLDRRTLFKIKVPLSLPKWPRLLDVLGRSLEIAGRLLPIRTEIAAEPVFSNSKAYCLTGESQGIYINDTKRFTDGNVDAWEEYNRIAAEIKTKLEKLRHPRTGRLVLKAVHSKEEVYNGAKTGHAPDLVVECDEYSLNSNLCNRIFARGPTSHHSPTGIFVAHGPCVIKGKEILGAGIIDIAPTLLHIFGLPIPADYDGRVLNEIFETKIQPRTATVSPQKPSRIPGDGYSPDEETRIRERLKALGYLD